MTGFENFKKKTNTNENLKEKLYDQNFFHSSKKISLNYTKTFVVSCYKSTRNLPFSSNIKTTGK